MILQIFSEQIVDSDYIDVLTQIVDEIDTEHKLESAYIIDSPWADPSEPVLLLSPRPHWLDDRFTVFDGPTVKATLGTSGGVTKLRWVIRQIVAGKQPSFEYVWKHSVDTLERPWSGDVVALDIEVSGDIRVDEPEDTDLLSLALTWKRHGDETYWGVVYGKDELAKYSTQEELSALLPTYELLTHNGKFDLRWVNRLLHLNLYPAEDTLLMHYARYPSAQEHGLKPVAKRILGAEDWESGAKQYLRGQAHFERIPQPVLCAYNAQDTYWTYRLWERLQEFLDEPAWHLYRDVLIPASHMLQDVEDWSLLVDVPYAMELDQNLAERIELEEDYFKTIRINPRSPKQVAPWLHDITGLPVKSTSKASLLSLLKSPVLKDRTDVKNQIDHLLELRKVTKARSTYVTSVLGKIGSDGRVHPTYKLHGTTSGRLSCSGPNVQNVTNDAEGEMSKRRMYVAPPGYVLVGADYSQAELRTMAELCGDPRMIADLQEDSPDFFTNMLPSVFTDVDFTGKDKHWMHPYRLRLKRIVYGSSYGLQPETVSWMLSLEGHTTSIAEAYSIYDGYLGRYPLLRKWREDTLPLVKSGDELITPFGRRFQQDILLDSNEKSVRNRAWSFRPQSIASDCCVQAAIWVNDIFKTDPKYGHSHIVALVHDAIYAEVPEAQGEMTRRLIEGKMRESGATIFHRVPFLTDSKVGTTWDTV